MHTSHTNLREKFQIILQMLIKAVLMVVYKIFYKVEIIGAEKAVEEIKNAQKKGKGMLLVANHTNELDGPFLRTFLPLPWLSDPMYYVAMTSEHYNKSAFDWRKYAYGGWLFKVLGAFPAYKGMKDYQASLVNHIELLEQQKIVCIFPEGKINRDPNVVADVRGGVGFLADFTDTDIIPVKTEGLMKLEWKKALLGKKPLIRITYKPLVQIAELMQNARDKGLTETVDLYKDVAVQAMTIVRSK